MTTPDNLQPLPGERYEPSNGVEGACFQESWCCNCERDKQLNGTVRSEDAGDEDWCPIVAASYRGEAVEWRELEDGKTVCLAFVPAGQQAPPPRGAAGAR